MVDLAEIQTAYYMVAATGVLVAAVFYILNLMETIKNRRAALTLSLVQSTYSLENGRANGELLNMQWKDWGDFYSKYDSTVNIDNYAKRAWLMSTCEALGLLYRKGMLDKETLYNLTSNYVLNFWIKFKPLIEEYRKLDYGSDAYKEWESLANEFARIRAEKDPSWKGSASHIKSEDYERTFNS
jgi:hypothetical protein